MLRAHVCSCSRCRIGQTFTQFLLTDCVRRVRKPVGGQGDKDGCALSSAYVSDLQPICVGTDCSTVSGTLRKGVRQPQLVSYEQLADYSSSSDWQSLKDS